MREEFEKAFLAPPQTMWSDNHNQYINCANMPNYMQAAYQMQWVAWQAATALQAERVRELERLLNDSCCHSHGEAFSEHCGWCVDTRKALSATAREG